MEFSNGELKSGFVNTSGKLVIPFKYGCDNNINFSEGLCAVYVPITGGVPNSTAAWSSYGFIDKTGKLVIPYSYEQVVYEGFKNGRARVSNNSWESTLYIDKKGKIVDQTGENELVTLLNGSRNSTTNTTKNKKKTTNINDDAISQIMAIYRKNESDKINSLLKEGLNVGNARPSKNASGSSPSKSSSSNTASKHTFKVTVTWNNPNCGSCPFPRPSAQNGSIDYFYERSGSYTVKPKCPICGKTQYNTIAGFTDNIGTSNQGSKVVTISCN